MKLLSIQSPCLFPLLRNVNEVQLSTVWPYRKQKGEKEKVRGVPLLTLAIIKRTRSPVVTVSLII